MARVGNPLSSGRAAEAITAYGGHVAKYLDDGVMALFSYPDAHGNGAERVARAGLAILETVSKLNQASAYPRSWKAWASIRAR
jgi:class 3 adenylate cyclase